MMMKQFEDSVCDFSGYQLSLAILVGCVKGVETCVYWWDMIGESGKADPRTRKEDQTAFERTRSHKHSVVFCLPSGLCFLGEVPIPPKRENI